MSNVAPFYKVEDDGADTKYYLKSGSDAPDTAITADQYAALEQYGQSNAATVSGSLSQADLVRLHAEQDPASPLYKGSQPTGTGVSVTAAGAPEPATGYYEPTADKIDPIADAIPAPQGTTTITTEQATIPPEIETSASNTPIVTPEPTLTSESTPTPAAAPVPEPAPRFEPIPDNNAGITGA